MEWFHVEYEVPSRTDFYLMQVSFYVSVLTLVVGNMFSKRRPRPPKLSDFRLRFDEVRREADRELQLAVAKSRWFAMTGYSKEK